LIVLSANIDDMTDR